MQRCKKAQVGETVTWMVGTVIIILMMTVFFFIAGLMGAEKDITISVQKAEVGDNNWVEFKTSEAFGISSARKGAIEEWIKTVEERNER